MRGARRVAVHRTLACLICLSAAISASPQSIPGDDTSAPKLIPRTKAEREAQSATHHRILLNVQATDPSGHAVPGLRAQDFSLQINHQPQTITSFHAVQDGGATAHAHAFFVIDMLNNSARDLANVRKALEELTGSTRLLPLPTSVVVLTDKGMEVSGTSQNPEEIASGVERVTRNFHFRDCTEDWNNAAVGRPNILSPDEVARLQTTDRISNCLNEKYQRSLTALLHFAHYQRDVSGRAILIWIGPGWPILSGPEFTRYTPAMRQSYFENLVQVSTQLSEGQVTLDAVSWPSSLPVGKLSPSDLEALMSEVSTASEADARSVAMPVLAHVSGGQVYMHGKNLTPELAACLADANSYYVLGFDSVPSAAADEFRTIEVTVDKPGVTVRTNTEYYAQP